MLTTRVVVGVERGELSSSKNNLGSQKYYSKLYAKHTNGKVRKVKVMVSSIIYLPLSNMTVLRNQSSLPELVSLILQPTTTQLSRPPNHDTWRKLLSNQHAAPYNLLTFNPEAILTEVSFISYHRCLGESIAALASNERAGNMRF